METFQEREAAFAWASSLDLHDLHWMVTIMTDLDALQPAERKAILEVVSMRLGRELRGENA